MLRRECDHVRLGRRAPCLRAFMAVALACCLAPAGAALARAQGAAPSYRIFLTDGTPIVSFGEFARANGRVVFTVPIGSPANPDTIQVVSLPDSVVDWDRTDRYTDAVRHQFYASTRGEDDYAALTGAVARALGEIAYVGDPGSKLAIAADIRRQLLEWPAAHFGYRSADVRELTALVEEAISGIRAGSGQRTFDLSLVAMVEAPSEPLLPEPQLKDVLDYATVVARMTDSRRERLTLQESIVAVLDRSKRLVPRDWYSSTRKGLTGSIKLEREADRAYADLTSRTLRDASDARSGRRRGGARTPRPRRPEGRRAPRPPAARDDAGADGVAGRLHREGAGEAPGHRSAHVPQVGLPIVPSGASATASGSSTMCQTRSAS